MIPLRLTMHNFMCYREQTLDLSGIRLACLAGDNGHGKSAILDALTWSLWGYSRVGARRDDELIHIGQPEMEVAFEFKLANARYRVIRKRDKRKRGQSSLEYQLWDAKEGRFRPLTEPTIYQTQQAINDLLRMDYATFINSAFLLQGRADEFTVKRPGERKEILGNILGLDVYTEYEQAAKKAAQDHKARADQLLAAIEQMDMELDREPEYKAALQAAEAELGRLQNERVSAQEAYDRLQAETQEAESAQRQLTDLQKRMAQAGQEADRLAQEIAAYQARLDEFDQALANQEDIERGFAAYQRTVQQNEAMNADLGKLVSLNEQHNALQAQITAAGHELDKVRHSAAEEVQRLTEATRALERESEWREMQAELAHLQEREAERTQAQGEIQAQTAESATLVAENKQAEEDAEQIKEKIDLLGQEAQACCPLCGKPLADDECRDLLASFEAELESKRDAYRERNAHIKEARQQIDALKATIREIDRALQNRNALQRKEAALAHTVQEAVQASEALAAAQATLQAIEARLGTEDYAPEAREALRQVEQALGDLGYDAEAHRRIQADVQALRPYEGQMQTLREARSGIETIHLAMSQLAQRRHQIEEARAADGERAAGLEEIARRVPDLRKQVLAARQAVEAAHDREQRANLRLGAARTKVAHCADLRQQRVARQEEEQRLREDQAIYQELQHAFGKNGVQAMLIEAAIPDIEEEANRLLARMTGGRMQVRFETQRDMKRGGTAETLDIHIADELGTRSYETYSGGERYRINFAIRVALSRLLTRRAGAQLEMLVIDEGFGTQDNEGRDGLMDAINAVSEDFGCILAITHIPELKDAFNVRIQVTKTAQGSEIEIV
jgi:exonuclease SbcC